MARPKKNLTSIKAIQVNVRMTVDQYLIMEEKCKTLGITIPDFIRKKVEGKPLPRKNISVEFRKLFAELNRLGNNVNQLTKQGHLGMYAPQSLHNEMYEVKRVLNALRAQILNYDSKAD